MKFAKALILRVSKASSTDVGEEVVATLLLLRVLTTNIVLKIGHQRVILLLSALHEHLVALLDDLRDASGHDLLGDDANLFDREERFLSHHRSGLLVL